MKPQANLIYRHFTTDMLRRYTAEEIARLNAAQGSTDTSLYLFEREVAALLFKLHIPKGIR